MLTALSVPIVKLIGLQGTLLRLKSHLPAAPHFLFSAPPRGCRQKKKKTGGRPVKICFTPQRNKRGYSWSYENRPLGQTKNTSDISGYIARVLS